MAHTEKEAGQNPEPAADEFDKAVVRFGFELRQLALEERHGWLRIDAKGAEDVAQHSHRATIIGMFLAHLEGYEEIEKVAAIIALHDVHETRPGDHDVVQKRYVQVDDELAISDQLGSFGSFGERLKALWSEAEGRSTQAGIIAKDADVLEMVFRARELVVDGNQTAQTWIDNSRERLQTESAKRLLEIINTADPTEWWQRMF